MSSPSPLCTVKDGAGSPQTTPPVATVTDGNTVTIALADVTGVSTWGISCTDADETSTASAITSALTINPTTKQASFTAPAAGKAMLFRSVVNGGISSTTGQADSSLTSTFKVSVPTANGLHVGTANERLEHSPTSGWVGVLNETVREVDTLISGGGGGGGSSNAVKDPVRCVLTAALAANTISAGAGTITGNANGVIPSGTADGLTLTASDRVLVGDTGIATGSARGIYAVTQAGDGSHPFILTRATDTDATGELLTGTKVRVNEGTVNAGLDWVLTTSGTVTIGTTSQSWSVATVTASLPSRAPDHSADVLWYKCDDSASPLVNSGTAGVGANLTATGIVFGHYGLIDKCILLEDALSTRHADATGGLPVLGAAAATICAWFTVGELPAAATYARVFGYISAGSDQVLDIFVYDVLGIIDIQGKCLTSGHFEIGLPAAYRIQRGQTVMVAAVKSAGTMSIYVNGVGYDVAQANNLDWGVSGNWVIGDRNAGGTKFNGQVHLAWASSTAYTAAQIAAEYRLVLGRS